MEPEKTEKDVKKCGSPHSHAKCFIGVIILLIVMGIICFHVHHPGHHHHGSKAFEPSPGTTCTIQFRRGAENSDGAVVSIQGSLVFMDRDVVILANGNQNTCIPRENIHFIQYDAPVKK